MNRAKKEPLLGVIEQSLRPCLTCSADVMARLTTYVRRGESGRIIEEGATWEPEPHPGPCGAQCERGFTDWKPGKPVHRRDGCVRCQARAAKGVGT